MPSLDLRTSGFGWVLGTGRCGSTLVHEVLARHPGVREVAVVGEPDERWGQRVVAFVVAAPGLTAAALDAHCTSGGALAPFKRPKRVVFVDEIPKTASGKILRRLLRDGQYSEITT